MPQVVLSLEAHDYSHVDDVFRDMCMTFTYDHSQLHNHTQGPCRLSSALFPLLQFRLIWRG